MASGPPWDWWSGGALYRVLQPAADVFTYRLLGLARESHLGRSVEFFAFEVPKVLLLLVLVVRREMKPKTLVTAFLLLLP